jgi:hypothetical protein
MIYIEIIQSSGGRTGHKLKDYLTAFCFYFICNYKIIINKYWNFPENNCNNHLDMFNLNSSNIFITRPKNPIIIEYSLANWDGMKYDKFKEITKNIEDTQKENANKSIIVKLSKATRIQLSDVYNWELSNLIEKGTYNKLISHLRSLLLSSPINNQIPIIKNENNIINISIHIRKGDVYLRKLHQSVSYYENIINNLKKLEFKKNIYIFTEKWKGYNGKDVLNLINLKDNNTNIEVIFDGLYEYIVDIINSDIFVATIGQGSFSDLVVHYKSKNTIIIYNNELRQNKFNDNMNNMLIKTEKNGDFDIKYLQNNVHLKLPEV